MPLCCISMFIRIEGFSLWVEKSRHISDCWLNSEPSGKNVVSYLETTRSSYKLHSLYCYITKIREVVMGWYVEEVGDRECFQILVGKPSVRHPLGRPWRWEGNIKLGFVLYCGRVLTANAPGCTAAEGLLYKPWSLVVPTCTTRCLHQRT